MDFDPSYTAQQFKSVGTRPLRPDGVDKVTGRARYGAEGLKAAQGFVGLLPPQGPFAREAAIGRELARRLARD